MRLIASAWKGVQVDHVARMVGMMGRFDLDSLRFEVLTG